jgi:hypothetical protein
MLYETFAKRSGIRIDVNPAERLHRASIDIIEVARLLDASSHPIHYLNPFVSVCIFIAIRSILTNDASNEQLLSGAGIMRRVLAEMATIFPVAQRYVRLADEIECRGRVRPRVVEVGGERNTR